MHPVRAVIFPAASSEFLVAGIPVIARTVLSLWSAGIRTFTIVGSRDAESAIRARREIARAATDATVHWVATADDDPERTSLARVVVAAADGIFATPAASRLIAQGRLRNIFVQFQDAPKRGLRMISAAAYAEMLAGYEIDCDRIHARSSDYHPIAERADIDAAERRLFGWCIKQTDGVVSRYFNRPISTWISRHLSHHDIAPRELTAVTALLAVTTFMCLMAGTLAGLTLGCVLYHVTSVVDGLDGEIARAKFMSTRTGAALDTGVDMASNLLFMVGISLGCADVFGPQYLWMGTFIGATATAAIVIMTMVLRFGPGGGSFDVLQLTLQRRLAPYPRLARVFVLAHAAFKRDLFALLFALLGLSGTPQAIPWLLAFGTSIWLVAVVMNAPAMLRANREDILPPHLRTAPALVGVTQTSGQSNT